MPCIEDLEAASFQSWAGTQEMFGFLLLLQITKDKSVSVLAVNFQNPFDRYQSNPLVLWIPSVPRKTLGNRRM